VEKLSTIFVDKWMTRKTLWKVWISYPHFLWITIRERSLCGKCGKVVHNICG
jgi:hypothetical protein